MDKPVSRVFVEYADVITCLIPELKSCVRFNQNNRYHKKYMDELGIEEEPDFLRQEYYG